MVALLVFYAKLGWLPGPGRLEVYYDGIVTPTTGFILRNLLLMVFSRWRRYGYACVNFGTPVSIRDYCRESGTVFSQLQRDKRFPEIAILCRRLMSDIAGVIPVLPVSLVSAVFLDAPTAEMDILAVEQRANRLIDELQENQAPIFEAPRSTRMADIADAIRIRTSEHGTVAL